MIQREVERVEIPEGTARRHVDEAIGEQRDELLRSPAVRPQRRVERGQVVVGRPGTDDRIAI